MPAALLLFFYFEKNPDKTIFFFHQNIMRHLFVNVKHKMLIHVL